MSRRFPAPQGSSDAWTLAREIATRQSRSNAAATAGAGRVTHVIVCAQSADRGRLKAELGFMAPGLAIAELPDWETLPYDNLSPHQDLVSERLAALQQLAAGRLDVLVVAATTAAHRVAPPSWLAARTFDFSKGQQLDEAALKSQLTLAGYEHVTQVMRPGEYAVRGGLIDLFPMGSALPYRLDLFDDRIDTLRTFDPDNQRSLYPVDAVRLLPGREFPLDEPARAAFRGRWRERFDGDPSRVPLYRDIGNGIAANGIEYYLPLFFAETATFFDYLPAETVLVMHGDVQAALVAFRADADERYRFIGHDAERPALRPDELFLDAEAFFVAAKDRPRWTLPSADGEARYRALPVPPVAINRRLDDPVALLKDALAAPGPAAAGPTAASADDDTSADAAAADDRPAGDGPVGRRLVERRLIVAESAGRRETLHELFLEHGLRLASAETWQEALASPAGDAPAILIAGPIQRGFRMASGELLVITEAELFPGFVRQTGRGRSETATQVDSLIRDLSELKPGDPVVHAQHGIGRYQGLVNLDLGEGATEFLHLAYAGDATLYVPVSQLHLIGRYSGASPEAAPLHALGSGQWEKARRKAAEKARDTAAELLDLYARRAAREGHPFKFDPAGYEAFIEGFGFEETADQQAAIHAVIQDLVAAKPMDRLVCGDVGFGKTEVALRAAFVVAATGRQVAVLTPTTLLAEQHFQTFRDRFANWPIRIAELSRFANSKDTRAAIDGLKAGSVDIVIGTHKLLGKEVQFKDLGLVIIDEEHRFGVRQKEMLKTLRAEIDVLTLTATPIPRTLAMSLEGIRDFSVIATAPQKRLAIKTFVRNENDGTIREALLRELKRGGQVYFLHNEVSTIGNRLEKLQALVPEARIRIAHGQMPERELEQVMKDFHQQRFNVLLCTTIIETGIDVPTANTIVMHRADRFGLAQLHQLRGRVGRSHHQAYAYLLIPNEEAITRDAQKRLEAIQLMEELGSGFYLSMHDLEIRGAGEVLGEDQSGEMQEVGFALYTEMLQQAVKALKSGKEPDLATTLARVPEINLHAPALLPDDYCPDVHERLMLYKRLANATAAGQVVDLREEIIDRFGRLPEAATTLVEVHRLRLDATAIGLAKVDASSEAVVLQFDAQPVTPPAQILAFAQSRRDTGFAGQDRLRIRVTSADVASRIRIVKEILSALLPGAKLPKAVAGNPVAGSPVARPAAGSAPAALTAAPTAKPGTSLAASPPAAARTPATARAGVGSPAAARSPWPTTFGRRRPPR